MTGEIRRDTPLNGIQTHFTVVRWTQMDSELRWRKIYAEDGAMPAAAPAGDIDHGLGRS